MPPHGGGTKLSRPHRTGAAGVLADSRLRDFTQLGGYGFATRCRGEATRSGGDTIVPFAANIAVEIGGVCVAPGDYPNSWVIMNPGGRPTPDRPDVSLEPPTAQQTVSAFMNIRVADIEFAYDQWRAKGAPESSAHRRRPHDPPQKFGYKTRRADQGARPPSGAQAP